MERIRIHDEIDDENCGEIKLQKLGEALRYGLTNELPEYVKTNEGSLYHLYGSIACLYLYGCLSNQVAAKVDMEIYMGSGGESKINGVVEELSKLLFENLREKFVFDTFEELENQLNLFRVPQWCFYIGTQLIKYYAKNSYLYNDILYYIGSAESDFGSALIKIDVKRICSNTDLEDEEDRTVLLNGFRKIYGVDTKMQRIYLELHGPKYKFAYYDIIGDKLVICDNKFHALKDGNLFVVTEDNYIALLMGDSIHKIKEYQECAKYELRKDYFFVYPDELSDCFFYPYYLYFDGKLLQADRYDAKRILWERISSGVSGMRDSVLSRFISKLNDSTLPMPKELSISAIRDTLNDSIPSSERCKIKGYILFDNMLGLITNYIDKNRDITQLLYALCEVNLRVCKNESEFPSEELYWRLKGIAVENIDNSNSLATLLQSNNYEMLIKEIVKEEKVKTELSHEQSVRCRIGFLYDSPNGIRALSLRMEDGFFVGNHVLPVCDYSKCMGIVSYDAYTNVVYVTTNRVLSGEERLFVSKEFKVGELRCTFVLQPMVENRKGMCANGITSDLNE